MDSSVDHRAPLRAFPAAVASELGGRRRQLLERARGRVLDLDVAADRATLASVMAAPGDPLPAPRYDTIVSTGALVDQPDLHASVSALNRLLADDGDLLLVEPVNHPGVAGLLASSLTALAPSARGRHLSRDVVATVRSVGLTVADLDRFTIPTAAWSMRRWIEARAVRIPHRVPVAAVGDEP